MHDEVFSSDGEGETSGRAVIGRCKSCQTDIGEFYNSFVKVRSRCNGDIRLILCRGGAPCHSRGQWQGAVQGSTADARLQVTGS